MDNDTSYQSKCVMAHFEAGMWVADHEFTSGPFKGERFTVRVPFTCGQWGDWDTPTTGKVVCMDCKILIKYEPRMAHGKVSHGLCDACLAKRLADLDALRIQRDSVLPHSWDQVEPIS